MTIATLFVASLLTPTAAQTDLAMTIAAHGNLVRVTIENTGTAERVLDLGWIQAGVAHPEYVQLFAGRLQWPEQSYSVAKPAATPAQTTRAAIRLPGGGVYRFDLSPAKYRVFAPDGSAVSLAGYLSQPSELRVQLNLREVGALVSNTLCFPARTAPPVLRAAR